MFWLVVSACYCEYHVAQTPVSDLPFPNEKTSTSQNLFGLTINKKNNIDIPELNSDFRPVEALKKYISGPLPPVDPNPQPNPPKNYFSEEIN